MKSLIAVLVALFSTGIFAAERFVPVLMYHQIKDEPSRENISLSKFRQQIDWLMREGYTTVTISQLHDFMEGRKTLPNNTVAITIDDGWVTALEAANLLRQNKMAATFYIISGMFTHSAYMSEHQVRQLATNPQFEIGAHSHTHFMQWVDDLSKLDTRIAVGEMLMSKRLIEDVIQRPIRTYAWPFGYVRPDMMSFASAVGFTSTVHVNAASVNKKGTSPLEIQRINVDGRCSFEQFKSMVVTGVLERCTD
jgi:peptidoglycan/xylan/chitin deacetylase (PgdA/CDA1 family)